MMLSISQAYARAPMSTVPTRPLFLAFAFRQSGHYSLGSCDPVVRARPMAFEKRAFLRIHMSFGIGPPSRIYPPFWHSDGISDLYVVALFPTRNPASPSIKICRRTIFCVYLGVPLLLAPCRSPSPSPSLTQHPAARYPVTPRPLCLTLGRFAYAESLSRATRYLGTDPGAWDFS